MANRLPCCDAWNSPCQLVVLTDLICNINWEIWSFTLRTVLFFKSCVNCNEFFFFLEIPKPVRVAILLVGSNDAADGRVAAVHLQWNLLDWLCMHHMLVNDHDPFLVWQERLIFIICIQFVIDARCLSTHSEHHLLHFLLDVLAFAAYAQGKWLSLFIVRKLNRTRWIHVVFVGLLFQKLY